MIDALVGTAVSGIGASGVYGLRDELSAEACRAGAERIWHALANVETAEAFHERDRIWSQYAMGWSGRLHHFLTELTDEYFMDLGPPAFYSAMNRQAAAARLVALELTARAMFLEGGQWPRTMDDLAAAGMPPDALLDPFSPEGGRLRLLKTDDGVVFYSVGPDGVDDGGAPTDSIDLMEGGDLRLDAFYAP